MSRTRTGAPGRRPRTPLRRSPRSRQPPRSADLAAGRVASATLTVAAWSLSPNGEKIVGTGRTTLAGDEMMTQQPPSARLRPRPGSSADLAALIPQLTASCGQDGVITDAIGLLTYENYEVT